MICFFTTSMAMASETTMLKMSGLINQKLKIHMTLFFRENQVVTGTYYYDKYKIEIDLGGWRDQNNQILIREYPEQGKWTGNFDGELGANVFKGKWINPEGTKEFPFLLTIDERSSIPNVKIDQFSTYEDDYLYVSGRTEGIFVYNVVDPEQPVLKGHVASQEKINKMIRRGNYLFVLKQREKIELYQLSIPTKPDLYAVYDNLMESGQEIDDFFIEDGLLIVMDKKKNSYLTNLHLNFFDISNLKSPQLRATYIPKIPDYDSMYSTRFEYVYCNYRGYFSDDYTITVMDFSDLDRPVQIYHDEYTEPFYEDASYEILPRSVDQIVGAENSIFVLRERGLIGYNFSDFSNVSQPEYEEFFEPEKLVFESNQLFGLSEGEVRFYTNSILDFTEIQNSRLQDVNDIVIRGHYAYLAGGKQGLVVLNLKNNKLLPFDSMGQTTGFVEDVFLGGHYVAFKVNNDHIDYYDRGVNSLVDTYMTRIGKGGGFAKVLQEKDKLYFLENSGDFSVVDLWCDLNSQNGWYNLVDVGYNEKLEFNIRDDLIVVADAIMDDDIIIESNVHFYNVTDSSVNDMGISISLNENVDNEYKKVEEKDRLHYRIENIFVKDDYLYLNYTVINYWLRYGWLEAGSGSILFDISDIQTPKKIADLPYFSSVVGLITNDLALLKGGQILDLRNPKDIKIERILKDAQRNGRYLGEPIHELEIKENYGFVSCGVNGLLVYDFFDPKNPILVEQLKDDIDAQGIAIVDQKLYLANGYDGYRVYDISDPTDLILLYDSVQENLFEFAR